MKRTQKWILPILILALVFCFAAPLSAEPSSGFMVDEVGLLTPEDLADLNEQAAAYASAYNCGIYGYIVDDYTMHNSESVLEAAKTIYTDNALGVGENANGVLLLLSMADRDYALIVYGEEAKAAFNATAQDDLSDAFLDDFGEDNWYAGFSDYISYAEKIEDVAASGDEYTSLGDKLITAALIFLLPCVIALVICLALRRGMKTAREGTVADAYIIENSAEIYDRDDHFCNVTEVRTEIVDNDNDSHNIGGGFSGKSGKF